MATFYQQPMEWVSFPPLTRFLFLCPYEQRYTPNVISNAKQLTPSIPFKLMYTTFRTRLQADVDT